MKVTEYVVDMLHEEAVEHLFLYPGFLLMPFLVELPENPRVTHICASSETGAAYMADGYARASGRFGACLCIGGPGITNMYTPIATARTDQSPILVVSAEVPSTQEGRGTFQDTSAAGLDDIAIMLPVSNYSMAIEEPHLVEHHLRAALVRMLGPVPGPVHISLPNNIMAADVPYAHEKVDDVYYSPRFVDSEATDELWDLLHGAKKIGVLAGVGVEKSGASEALVAFAERFELPVATTLRAKGVFPEDHRLSMGVFGFAGTRHAIEEFVLSDELEVLIVLGSGLNQLDTLFWSRDFRPSKALVHVDRNPGSIGCTFHTELPIFADAGAFLDRVLHAPSASTEAVLATNPDRVAWVDRIRQSGSRLYDAENLETDVVPIHPARVLNDLRDVMPRETMMVVDTGAHTIFAGHYWDTFGPLEFYTSRAHLGPMGWAIPAAVGVRMARPDGPLVVLTGDGCMGMQGVEIQTASRYDLDITFVVLNNSSLAAVREPAVKQGEGAVGMTDMPTRDWAGFARALGLTAETVTEPGELTPAFQRALDTRGPVLLDVIADKSCATPSAPWEKAGHDWLERL